MLGDDEDVFDSVTWESPASNANYDRTEVTAGPGFRQSTADSEDGNPHDPKWEGYLITSVKDPVKELAETKDAYVSYLVTATVCLLGCSTLRQLNCSTRPTCQYIQPRTLHQGGVSKISYSYATTSLKISRHV